jgi:hypothetical protein
VYDSEGSDLVLATKRPPGERAPPHRVPTPQDRGRVASSGRSEERHPHESENMLQ